MVRCAIIIPGSGAGPTGELAFPATVSPAVWLDGNRQAYSDLAGTLPVSSGLIRRINEPPSPGGNWTTPTDPERPFRDTRSVRFECIGSAGGYQMTRPDPGGIFFDACTVVVAYMARDNHFAGPLMGLFEESTQRLGVRISSNEVWALTPVGNFFTGLLVAPGRLNVIAVTYTPTGVEVKLDAGGTITTAIWSTAIAHTAASSWLVGRDGAAYLYGSVTQAFAVSSSLSSADRDAVMAWAKAQPAPAAYPDDRALLCFVGDSITRATGATYSFAYPFLALSNIRATKPLTEVCNTAVGGSGVTRIIDPTSGSSAQDLLIRACSFYSVGRAKNILVLATGTNDLANGNGAPYTLNGTGATGPAAGTTGLYPAIAYAKAAGFQVIVITPGPRSDAMAVSQATYNADRDTVANSLVANAAGLGYTCIDTRPITNFGGNGDSNNLTYYNSDKIHPNNAGHALLEPSVRAAALALL